MINNQNGLERMNFVLRCRNTPQEQFRAKERLGCLGYYPISTTLRKGQAKCCYCGKRTRYDTNDGISMSGAIVTPLLASRSIAKQVSLRMNAEIAVEAPTTPVEQPVDDWFTGTEVIE